MNSVGLSFDVDDVYCEVLLSRNGCKQWILNHHDGHGHLHHSWSDSDKSNESSLARFAPEIYEGPLHGATEEEVENLVIIPYQYIDMYYDTTRRHTHNHATTTTD